VTDEHFDIVGAVGAVSAVGAVGAAVQEYAGAGQGCHVDLVSPR
jgi:hypothetical protein